MEKLFLISFFVGLFLIPSFCLSADPWQVEDHFNQANGTPTSFTNFGPGGSFTVTNNQLVCTGVYNEGYDNTPLTQSFRQWAKVHVIQLGQGGESAAEILVRVDSADLLFYGARWQNNGTVQIHTGNFTSSAVSDIIFAGDWIGIEVENTGANTTWRVWKWATDPGDRAVWGSPKGTWGVGGRAFTLAVYSNTYLYAGLADLGNATKAIYDDFYANSSAYRAPSY